MLFDNQLAKSLIFPRFEPGIDRQDAGRDRPRLPHQVGVLDQVSQLQRRQSALRRPQQIPWPAHFPISFRDGETVAGFRQHVQFRHRFRRFLVAQQNAIRLMGSVPDPAAQLMQLRQPETLRILDQH